MEDILNKFDNYLKKHIPISYKFSGIGKAELRQKLKGYNVRFDNLIEISKTKNGQYLPHCIFDLLILAENDKTDGAYIRFLHHIDKTVDELKNSLDVSFHKRLRETTRQMIISFDEEIGSNYQFLNFYGELLGLNSFLSQNEKVKLIDIERKLPNGKSVDFVFKHEGDDIPLYVDFVSYHNIKPDLLESKEEFISFFENKFSQKLDSKTQNLKTENIHLLIDNQKIPFIIQPIIWTEIDLFQEHLDAIQIMDEKYGNVARFASLLVQRNNEGKIFYNFTSVSNILERIINEKK